jgi:hypothetical protein
MEKLRSLLKTYEERTAKAGVDPGAGPGAGTGAEAGAGAGAGPRPEVRTIHDEGERRRRACGERLQKVVRPVLQAFMDELRNASHDASIQDHTDSADAYPSVALALTPRAPGGSALASVLTFRYDPRRGIAVSRDIKPSATKARLVTASTDRIGTMKVDAVSAEWVATKTLSFIEAVLKAN